MATFRSAMTTASSLLLLSVLVLVALFGSSPAWAQEDTATTTAAATEQDTSARLLVHKSVPQFDVIVGSNLTFTISIYNTGKLPVYDVNLQDNEWPEEFFEIQEGANRAHFDVIEPSAHVTHTYSIAPRNTGEINTTPAKVSFRISPQQQENDDEDRTNVVRSTELPTIPVLTTAQYNKKHNNHFDEWAIFSLLFAAAIGLPYLIYVYSNNKIEELRH